jgi:hypothetical protein
VNYLHFYKRNDMLILQVKSYMSNQFKNYCDGWKKIK